MNCQDYIDSQRAAEIETGHCISTLLEDNSCSYIRIIKMLLFPPQTPHGMACVRTQVSPVRCRQPTAWLTTQPNVHPQLVHYQSSLPKEKLLTIRPFCHIRVAALCETVPFKREATCHIYKAASWQKRTAINSVQIFMADWDGCYILPITQKNELRASIWSSINNRQVTDLHSSPGVLIIVPYHCSSASPFSGKN